MAHQRCTVSDRYYVCAGLREPYAVLDQDRDGRVFETDDLQATREMCKLLNEASCLPPVAHA